MGVTQSSEYEAEQMQAEQQQVAEILRRQGVRILHPFDHPTFGRLVLGMLEQQGRPSRHVYIREFDIASEEQGMLLYQYLLRQEQLENSAFLRIYSHLMKPVMVERYQNRQSMVNNSLQRSYSRLLMTI